MDKTLSLPPGRKVHVRLLLVMPGGAVPTLAAPTGSHAKPLLLKICSYWLPHQKIVPSWDYSEYAIEINLGRFCGNNLNLN